MSYSFEKLNGSKRFNFELDGAFDYKKLEDLYKDSPNNIMSVDGFMFREGKFGRECSAVSEENHLIVNLPRHLNEKVDKICNDDEAVSAVNAGHLGISVYQYKDKDGTDRYSANFHTIQREKTV